MQTLWAQRAKLGSMEYYIAKMPLREAVDSIGLAVELPEWKDMTIDEKMQREPDLNRIVNEICPYFISDPDRFWGSLIVDVSGSNEMIFEPISKYVNEDIGLSYKLPLEDVGFLTLTGKERLIALDGQHRLLAMKICYKGNSAISAVMLGNKKMTPQMLALTPHLELAEEEISVIFVNCGEDRAKTRKIFNKVNKYARQTGRGQNIITADDDVYAVIARRLFKDGEVLGKIGKIDLVNWSSNTLAVRSKQLTTVSALYTIAETLSKDKGWSTQRLPSDEEVEEVFKENADFWKELLDGIDEYKEFLELTRADKPVSQLRENNLLLKPVSHMALAHVAYLAKKRGLSWKNVVTRLNKIDWSFDNSLWYNILVIPAKKKKVITGKESIRAAGMVISYMVMGDKLTAAEVKEVKEIITNASNGRVETLPEKIY